MTTELLTVGPAQITPYSKRYIAISMYAKGKAFLSAAILLRRQGGYESVVLHLLCQGIEVLLKGILLLIDYDRYKHKLRRFSHNLVAVAEEAARAAKLFPMRHNVRTELETLSDSYSKHRFRYASPFDIFVNPKTIPSDLVLWRMAAVLQLVERKGLAAFPPS